MPTSHIRTRITHVLTRHLRRARRQDRERGDVPGWVMVTLMTAGLVVTLWAVVGPRLVALFENAMDRVLGT